MLLFHAIAAMSENRVIGNEGNIPWHFSDDFRWFKHKTMGGTLIMGRKTFDSIGKPLPGRKTVVLTRSSLVIPSVDTYSDLSAFLDADIPNGWVCGGAQIYEELLSRCECLYLTRVKRTVPGDTFFPSFEDDFTMNLVIHENADFRVERWTNNRETMLAESSVAPETWPFAEPE